MGQRETAGGGLTAEEMIELIPALRAFARSLCHNAVDADDLVQETLVKAIAGVDGFTPGTRLKSWLFTIMRNAFYTQAARGQRQPPRPVDCEPGEGAAASPQEWQMELADVLAAVRRLPPQFREVLLLVGMLGESYEDTAVICGCAVGTVKSRLSRARAMLAAAMGVSEGPASPPRAPARSTEPAA